MFCNDFVQYLLILRMTSNLMLTEVYAIPMPSQRSPESHTHANPYQIRLVRPLHHCARLISYFEIKISDQDARDNQL